MNKIKNYGFIKTEEDPKAYKLGATELPKVVLMSDGQWVDYLPKDESQITPSYDTYGCTVYGTENIQQMLEKFHYGESKEFDERYNYNLVKITPPGADPHAVAESFRNDGVISGELSIPSTFAEYSQPRPMYQKYIEMGVAHPYELRHQWLLEKSVDKLTRTKLIKEYLQYSPLGVSVTAWMESGGVYIDNGRPNTHWTVLYGFNDKGWLIYDSYAPHRKILSFDHNIQCVKRYQLVPSTRKLQISILSKIIALLSKLISQLITAPKVVETKPEPIVLPQIKPIREKILDEAKEWIGKEASINDLVADYVACGESFCNVMSNVMNFPMITGTASLFEYLKEDKRFKITTELKAGNIIISPTTYGNGLIPGHIGILLEDGKIVSNSSESGLWVQNYDVDSWTRRYRIKGGFPVVIFEANEKIS